MNFARKIPGIRLPVKGADDGTSDLDPIPGFVTFSYLFAMLVAGIVHLYLAMAAGFTELVPAWLRPTAVGPSMADCLSVLAYVSCGLVLLRWWVGARSKGLRAWRWHVVCLCSLVLLTWVARAVDAARSEMQRLADAWTATELEFEKEWSRQQVQLVVLGDHPWAGEYWCRAGKWSSNVLLVPGQDGLQRARHDDLEGVEHPLERFGLQYQYRFEILATDEGLRFDRGRRSRSVETLFTPVQREGRSFLVARDEIHEFTSEDSLDALVELTSQPGLSGFSLVLERVDSGH